MRIWTLNIDPDTGYIDLDSHPKSYETSEKNSRENYILCSGRKISKNSEFTKVFLTEQDAHAFRIKSLKDIKARYTKLLKGAKERLKEEDSFSSGRPRTLVRVISLDGTEQDVSIIRAMRIMSLSRSGLYSKIEKGNSTKAGYRVEAIS